MGKDNRACWFSIIKTLSPGHMQCCQLNIVIHTQKGYLAIIWGLYSHV